MSYVAISGVIQVPSVPLQRLSRFRDTPLLHYQKRLGLKTVKPDAGQERNLVGGASVLVDASHWRPSEPKSYYAQTSVA
jgi:hypothetical protein